MKFESNIYRPIRTCGLGLFLLGRGCYDAGMIYLACDHRGFVLKEVIKKLLAEQGILHEDMGDFSYDENDDYVDFARAAAEKIAENPVEHTGIFLCGSGHGMDMVANKYRGIRAALCWNTQVAAESRKHEDANVLVLPVPGPALIRNGLSNVVTADR